MKQYTAREFEKLVIVNGYVFDRSNGSHAIYVKNGDSISFPRGHNVNSCMAKRLIKEHKLVEEK